MDTLQADLAGHGLTVAGVADTDDGCVVLISPDEPAFWTIVRAAPEFADGHDHPIDRWSKRVTAPLAAKTGGRLVYPSDGPPYAPFYTWALQTGRVWASPVGLLVQDVAGLFISFRAALVLPYRVERRTADCPCDTCIGQPCRTACPAQALTPEGYDVPGCHAYLDSAAGTACLTTGCAVRRACPVGHGRRPDEQSRYHMGRFHT